MSRALKISKYIGQEYSRTRVTSALPCRFCTRSCLMVVMVMMMMMMLMVVMMLVLLDHGQHEAPGAADGLSVR